MNRTEAYLSRTLISYGNSLLSLLVQVKPKLDGIYFDDYLYRSQSGETDNFLFYKIKVGDGVKLNGECLQFLRFVKKHKAYKTDYPVTLFGEHVVCFKVPIEFDEAVKEFKKSRYSLMYTKAQLKALRYTEFVGSKVSSHYCVLTRDPRAYESYKNALKSRFSGATSITNFPTVEEVKEFDLPWKPYQEILNYN